MTTALVTTTIHEPNLLFDYCRNAKLFGHNDISIIVAGDKKTPDGMSEFCANLQREFGFPAQYLGVKEQENLLKKWPTLALHLPYNSISRRNIAIWQGYDQGADVIITIDDDNYVLPDEDFIGWHNCVGKRQEVTTISATNGWYNVCELLTEKNNYPIFHRGYPLEKRWEISRKEESIRTAKIAVNAGLWLESPDIDALTWLDLPIETISYDKDKYLAGVALAVGTWCPFNSQNTALGREVIPAYFLSPFIGRYDDVWASYIVKTIADHLGDVIRFGRPLVKQARNPHNYLSDFDKERMGMELTKDFTDWLRGLTLSGTDYRTCFQEITQLLAINMTNIFARATAEHQAQAQQFVNGLQIWQELPVKQGIRA